MTIGETVNQLKDLARLDNADIHFTDRDAYSLLKKHRAWLIKREDRKNRILKNTDIMQTNGCIELIEVDITECCNINTCCKIKRTKDTLPEMVNADFGPLIGLVSPLDHTLALVPTSVKNWQNKQKLSTKRYDKSIYYWISNNYMYFPDLEWDFISIEAFFEDPVLKCGTNDNCTAMQDKKFACPEYLLGELLSSCLNDLNIHLQVPSQEKIDKNENNK